MLPNNSLSLPPDVSVTRLAVATRAPDTGASELNRWTASQSMALPDIVCTSNVKYVSCKHV
jgi:hypothetical protein